MKNLKTMPGILLRKIMETIRITGSLANIRTGCTAKWRNVQCSG